MLRYSYEKIQKMVQPLMDMMQEEFPNDCVLVIDPLSAKIIFNHSYLHIPNEHIDEIAKESIPDWLESTAKTLGKIMSEKQNEEL